MATIDTSLFPSATFKVDSGEAMPVTSRLNALRESQMGDIKFRQAQQEEADNMLLRQAYNAPDPVNFLAQQGRGDLVPAVKQSMFATQEAESKLKTQNLAFKTQNLAYDKAHHERIDQLIGDVTKYTTADQANSALDSMLDKGEIDPQTHSMYRNIVVSTPWPQAKTQILGGLRSVQEQFETAEPKTTIGKLQSDYAAAVQRGDKVAAASIKKAIDVEAGGANEYQLENLQLERRSVEVAEAQNKRDQATFDQEQSTAGKLGITKAAYQKLESAYPMSTAANESANFSIDSQIADLKALRDHKGLSSIAGPFDAATKGLQVTEDTTSAQALLDKVASGQTIQVLIDLRRSSPTGAGLSVISDKDIVLLKETTGLNQRQYTPALKAQINSAIEKLENAKEVMNKHYTTTYSYKFGASSAPAAGGASVAPSRPSNVPAGAKYSPSQKKWFWQDASGAWKSN